MGIPVPGRSKKPKHAYDCVESITRLELKDTQSEQIVTIVRVWREQESIDNYDLDDLDLWEAIKDMHPMYLKEIAVKLAEMPRVNAVEVIRASDGKGILIYPVWP